VAVWAKADGTPAAMNAMSSRRENAVFFILKIELEIDKKQ